MSKNHQSENQQAFLAQAFFPPIIGVDQLSILLHKTSATIFADCCRAPYRLPPSFKAPGAKSPLWVTEDVIVWLRQFPHKGGGEAPTPNPQKSKLGPPNKRERIKARDLGISVSEMRRLDQKGESA